MESKKIILALTLVMLLNVILPSLTFAAEVMDYKQYLYRLRDYYGHFDTPISNFEVYLNGKWAGATNVNRTTDQVQYIT